MYIYIYLYMYIYLGYDCGTDFCFVVYPLLTIHIFTYPGTIIDHWHGTLVNAVTRIVTSQC